MWAYEPANGSNFGSPGDVLEKCRWCKSFCTVVVACNVRLNCSLIDVEFTSMSHVIEHCMILRVSRILDTMYRKILASYAAWPGVALGMSALEPVETLSDAEAAPPVTKVEPKAAAPKKPPAKGKGAAAKTKTATTKTAAKKQKKTAKVPDDSEPPAADPPAESPGPSEASDEEGSKLKAKTKSAPKKALKRPASSAGSAQPAKRPASNWPSPSGELKVKKYPYTKKGIWAISVNGREYVQAGTESVLQCGKGLF